MARAHRHYIPGHIWHLTHRCHNSEFLLKFAKDRHRWLQWLYEAKRRYGLVILDYTVTSSHIHLLVYDVSGKDVIPKSIQLVAGRTGQEYNQRKSRKGAYWEDNYHATVIEDGEHLLRCIVYIDMNMVRAGVVEHPAQWKHGGYNEIQSPRRKYILIDYQTLMRLTGFEAYEKFQVAHRRWVQAAVDKANLIRKSHWTESIAVGSETFVAAVKKQMHHLAIGRLIRSSTEFCELRDPEASYIGHFKAQKGDIGLKNTLLWNESD